MSDDVNLFEYINDLRKESKMESDLLHKRISDMKDELMSEMKSMRQEQQQINHKMEQRVNNLERWKWSIVGGAIVLGFLISLGMNLTKILS
jgi:single-stranded DNA-specific DHH superfamily exonuclease